MPPFEKGQRVRFTTGPIGLLSDLHGYKFTEEDAKEGDEAEYGGPHPSIPAWVMVKVGDKWAPVHENMIEAV